MSGIVIDCPREVSKMEMSVLGRSFCPPMRGPVLALAPALALVACIYPEPVPDPPPPAPPPLPRTLSAVELYCEGRISRAQELWRKGYGGLQFKALHLLTANRYREVLELQDEDNEPLLRLRALAAWRAGDGQALEQAVALLQARRSAQGPGQEKTAAGGKKGFVDVFQQKGPGRPGGQGSESRAGVLPGQGPELAELEAMAALASSARGRRLRQLKKDTFDVASFDVRQGIPIIEGKLAGRTVRLIVDTGAEITVLDAGLAKPARVRLPEGASVKLQGNAGEVGVRLGLADSLTVLGATLAEVPVALADLSALPQALGISGILAVQDLFSESVIQIDYDRGEIRRTTESRVQGQELFFVYGRAIVGVTGQVRGGPPGLFRVDTGGRRSLLTDAYVKLAQSAGVKWELSQPEKKQVKGIGEATRRRRTVARGSLCLLQADTCVELERVPVDTTTADSLIRYAGKLGSDFFRGKVLELDYPALRLRLSPSERRAR